jgi:hypothetical protein
MIEDLALTPDIRGILAIIAVLMCFALSVIVFRVSQPDTTARQLAWLLLLEGMTLGSSSGPIFIFALGEQIFDLYPQFGYLSAVLHYACDSAMIAVDPVFLASALQTPMTKIFNKPVFRNGLRLYAAGIFAWTVLAPVLLPSEAKTTAFFELSMAGVWIISLSLGVTLIYGLIAALHAWFVSTGQAKERASIFALAFGFRDICWCYIYITVGIYIFIYQEEPEGFDLDIIYSLGTLIAVPLIAYGILKAHLFDIDLRIRWTIKQSTFAAMAVAIVFVLSESVEWLVASELGEIWGLAAATLVVFFVKPLQNAAEKIVSLIMPNTRNTEEYVSNRKLAVYEAAYSEANLDENISDRERILLAHLRESLGISETDAQSIENQIQNAATV